MSAAPFWLLMLIYQATRPRRAADQVVDVDLVGRLREVWTLGGKPGLWCGVPLTASATGNYGATVHNVEGTGRVWGWTPPGDLRAAQQYGKRLIADVEDRKSTKAKPSAGWTGEEVEDAVACASLVGGITSHGYVFKNLRNVLKAFADNGCTAYPQVYDSDRSTEPRKFLRTCVNMYRDAGFAEVVPLISASSGVDFLRAWLAECAELNVQAAIYSLQRLKQLNITCEQLA